MKTHTSILISFLAFSYILGCLPFTAGANTFVISNETTITGTLKPGQALKLSIESGAQTYLTGEKIVFELVLVNAGDRMIKVKELNEKSLLCNINGQSWGEENAAGRVAVILKPGEKARRKFKVGGDVNEGEFKVTCSYGMKINGINPTAERVFNIVR